MKRFTFLLLGVVMVLAGSMRSALALPNYLPVFNSLYGTTGTVLDTCGVCHVASGGGGPRNTYGKAFEAVATHGSDPTGALNAIASQASTCSGYTFLQLINVRINPGNGSCPAPVTCTDFTYSAFGTCQIDNTQSRTVTGYTPAGCAGTPSAAPVLTQTCTYVPPSTSVNIGAATGTGQITVATLTGGTNLTDVMVVSATDPSINPNGKPSDLAFTDGLVHYKVTGVATGGTVQVQITFPTAIPAGSKIYKVDSNGFHDFSANAIIIDKTVTLTLTDGGSGDSDGVANGVIVDPVGVASPMSMPPDTSGSGGGCSIGARQNRATAFADSLIILMPLLVMAALRGIRRRRKQKVF